jgi:hypothetical protein
MGKRPDIVQTKEEAVRLPLSKMNNQITQARLGRELAGTSAAAKASFKRLVWLEAIREEVHGIPAPKRRFNSR